MDTPLQSSNLKLSPTDNRRLALLCGQLDEHLHQVEQHLNVEITNRGNLFNIAGNKYSVETASKILTTLYEATQKSTPLTSSMIHLVLQEYGATTQEKMKTPYTDIVIHTKAGSIKARTTNQHKYLKNIQDHDINFAIGPAGTGKTYLAMAAAVEAFNKDLVKRLVLTRPVVEAGERLGFLPGDIAQKIDPYLRPIYDALYEMIGFEHVAKLIEKNFIEIAPLAYMRGRTLNDAFIILDEGQNTTQEQMKMFLTRTGFGSKVVITGDVTQIDLAKGKPSGLIHATEILRNIPGICFNFFDATDVVRHPLVQDIVKAYDHHAQE